MSEYPPSLSDQYEMVVDLLKHEDNLINLRTNWTLTVQALLFTAFAATLGLIEKFSFADATATPVRIGLLIDCGLGLLSCIAGFYGVSTAETQQIKLREWWRDRLEDIDDQVTGVISNRTMLYPPFYPLELLKSKFRASKYFLFLAIVWVAIIITIICSNDLVTRGIAQAANGLVTGP